jgi:hypothetical protein
MVLNYSIIYYTANITGTRTRAIVLRSVEAILESMLRSRSRCAATTRQIGNTKVSMITRRVSDTVLPSRDIRSSGDLAYLISD